MQIYDVTAPDGKVLEVEGPEGSTMEQAVQMAMQMYDTVTQKVGEFVDNAKFKSFIGGILKSEGGFVNHKDDKGGPTNYGITQKTLQSVRGKPVTEDDVKNLSEDEAVSIYKKQYFEDTNIAKISDERIQEMVLDHSINAGPKSGAKLLQRAIGVKDDGIIGEGTLKAVDAFLQKNGATKLLMNIADSRRKYYRDVVRANPKNVSFIRGWNNRVDEVLARLTNQTKGDKENV